MSFSRGSSFGSQGAPVSGWRLALALIAVSMDAVGCQKARSGLSPVATFVCTPCSYGSGMVTTLTFAPVAFSKPEMTLSGVLFEFCAAQMVRLTPSSFVSCAGHDALPALPPPEPGSLHPDRTSAAAAAMAAIEAAPFQAIFIELLSLCDVATVALLARCCGMRCGRDVRRDLDAENARADLAEGAGDVELSFTRVPVELPLGKGSREDGGDGQLAPGEGRKRECGLRGRWV